MSKFEGEQFLFKYGIHKKEEARESARKRKGIDGGRRRKPQEIISAYISRLERIFFNKDVRKRRRNIDAKIMNGKSLREEMKDAFAVKKENFPESYFQHQVRQAKERGLGEIHFTKGQKEEEIEKNIENQKLSLDKWLDYLISDDNPYPPHIKFFVMQGVMRLGRFDIDNYSFERRNKETVAPLPELDREALAKVMGSLYSFYSTDEGEDSETLQRMIKEGNDFGKLYAQAMKELDSQKETRNFEITKGEWRLFRQGSDPAIMQKTLEGKRSNLCIASGDIHAASYLSKGDMYIYYSEDVNGEPTVPRVAISVQDDVVWEVRGTYNKYEDIDPHILETDILEEKLEELPEGDKYLKRTSDMKRVTEIERKQENNEEPSEEDLRFIYEIDLDSKIEGFGYCRDSRIDEILSKREDKRKDISVVMGCKEEEVAMSVSELNEKTVVFFRDLDLYKSQIRELPQGLTHIVGSLDFESSQVKKFPPGLTHIGWYLNLLNSQIKKLPDDIRKIVKGGIFGWDFDLNKPMTMSKKRRYE